MAKKSRPTSTGSSKATAKAPPAVRWAEHPAEHDYPSAASFLRLIASSDQIEVLTALLSQAPTTQQHAKDVLRAARLPLLPADDPEVVRDLAKVAAGEALSPILLVRGDVRTGRLLQIADGYHRVCASYHLNEDTDIPCRLVDLPAILG
jgi:hypothetical protein